ncbi:OsmC family protein [Fodinibius salsisoli]|uniref:OsmC family protein n=1 Tax=Fodinibius salsisoli TaxID=2820877 RepID=A0ABT3PRD5_9BACT|nr:OsmC family protein [Fodinibius salsisoli]MCW9708427.1 OsmC family protein [Fodinibius salsisoli]
MAHYNSTIRWQRNGATFTDNRYKRSHEWHFDGGEIVKASSSPEVVPVPLSDPAAVDPEEAFIASLSSCHMLWFLSIAAKHGFIIDRYQDKAEGLMAKNDSDRLAITQVTLHPEVTYLKDSAPGIKENMDMHHEAHEQCFIANSVHTEIQIKPTMETISAG